MEGEKRMDVRSDRQKGMSYAEIRRNIISTHKPPRNMQRQKKSLSISCRERNAQSLTIQRPRFRSFFPMKMS